MLHVEKLKKHESDAFRFSAKDSEMLLLIMLQRIGRSECSNSFQDMLL